jgi:hypothetical protein
MERDGNDVVGGFAAGVNWAWTGGDLNDFSLEVGATLIGKPGVSLTGGYAFEIDDASLSWSF